MSVGVAGGICVPVSEAFQGRSVLYLSGRGFGTSAETILALQFLAEHFAARAWALGGHDERGGKQASQQRNSGELSPRERAVVGWLAFGKSSREVAMITPSTSTRRTSTSHRPSPNCMLLIAQKPCFVLC
jgi:hypothetical protein